MVIPEDVLTATQARFEAREVPRAGTEEKIAAAQTPQGSILDVDAPERVELRSRRVLRQPVVMDALKATADTSPVQPGQVREDQVLGDLVLERIIGGSNLLGIAFLELGTAVSRTVGRVIVRDRFQVRSFGTGFMISPRLALTNNHVLPDAQSARFSRLRCLPGLPSSFPCLGWPSWRRSSRCFGTGTGGSDWDCCFWRRGRR